MNIHDLKKIILDALFPIFCIGCQKEGEWLCEECSSRIEPLPLQVCPICERETSVKGTACRKCSKKDRIVPFKSLTLGTDYGRIAKAVHLFKYDFIEDIAPILGRILVGCFLKNDLPIPDLIIPIPIHRKRMRMRGFNQSELLAGFLRNSIAPGMLIPVSSDIVFRKRYTPPQMRIRNYQERKRNMRDIFVLDKKSKDMLAGKRVLLVDDIVTTGATISECAKTILAGGAKEVRVIALARQEIRQNRLR